MYIKNENKFSKLINYRLYEETPKRGLLAWAEEDFSKLTSKMNEKIKSSQKKKSEEKHWKHEKFASKRDMDVDIYQSKKNMDIDFTS